MNKETLQAFATRVTQANRSELVVVIYEAALASIAEGKSALEAGDVTGARHEIDRAKGMIQELMYALDMHYNISTYLRQLYIFGYRELCQGIAYRDPERFDHTTHILEGLLPSFKEVAKQDTSKPLMENTQTIVAGLTYGPGSDLRETIGVGVSSNRGFMA
ncbi:MAG: flagellar protein FliS [Eubacterium sp.]|nr:flagellar protein FliS [Eubacterium sp.]